jgi:hypothetical protein
MTGEMIVAVCLSALIFATGIYYIVYMRKEFAENYTDCTTVINSAPSKAKNIGE